MQINYRGSTYKLLAQPYCHLAHPRSVLLNNVFLHEGLCPSISAINRMEGLQNAVSPYALKAMSDPKEQTWERMRLALTAGLPSRKGAIFLVESEALTLRINAEWFSAESRLILKAHIVHGARVHRGDAKWLDGQDWETNAQRWAGEMSGDPIPEILVDGWVYCPDWRQSPFGVGAGLT